MDLLFRSNNIIQTQCKTQTEECFFQSRLRRRENQGDAQDYVLISQILEFKQCDD